MKHICVKCDGEVTAGDEVVQMLDGIWFGAITPVPTAPPFGEWHHGCFGGELTLNGQTRPYRCEECLREVVLGERISFLVIGKETSELYTVAEGRGYEIYTVRHHPRCP